jgi:anti-anti-sigma factor
LLRINTEVTEHAVVVRCSGRIVRGSEATALRSAVMSQNGPCTCLLIDLAEVDRIDAGGLGVLVELEQWAQSTSRTLKLVNPTGYVREVLEATRLSAVLEVSPASETPSQARGRAA